MSYRMQRACRLGQGRSVLAVPALGLAALFNLSCGSQFEASGGGGSAGAPGGTGGGAGDSGHSGNTRGGADGLGGTGLGGAADEAGAPAGGRGRAAGGAAGATSHGGFGGTVAGGAGGALVGGTGGVGVAGAGGTIISGGGSGTGGVPACLDPQTSDANCGACGYACVNGRHCAAGRCRPAWQPLSSEGAPAPRTAHAAGFVGTRYVVLGGSLTVQGQAVTSAAAYDVNDNAWTDLAPLNSARCGHQAVSTGSAILTFGGLTDCGNGTTTGPGLERFTPNNAAGAWATVAAASAPSARYAFAATWTGSALFVFGGGTNTLPAVSSGGLFAPSSAPAWSDASCALGGCERGGGYSMFTDGNFVRVWGGGPFGNAPAGLSYDLVGRSWSAWTVPAGTADHLAQRFADDGRRIYFLTSANVVSLYDRKTSSWLVNDTAAMPVGFCTEAAAAWTGSELVAWSGSCGGGAPVSVGGRYQPAAPN